MIRIVIADDHNLVRQSIVSLIDKEEDMEVVGEASTGHGILRLIHQHRCDVAILDIAMPLMNGIEVTRRIQSLTVDVHVIILSMHSDDVVIRQALKNGARGYLLKSSVVEELMFAIRSVSKGETFLSPPVASTVLAEYLMTESANEALNLHDQLSSREAEILQLIIEGRTNRDVANVLNISMKTVEKHRATLMKKLNVRSLPALILTALKHRLIFLEEQTTDDITCNKPIDWLAIPPCLDNKP